MACAAVLFSTATGLIFSFSLLAFGDPTPGQVTLGYLLVAKLSFWAVIMRHNLCDRTPAPDRAR